MSTPSACIEQVQLVVGSLGPPTVAGSRKAKPRCKAAQIGFQFDGARGEIARAVLVEDDAEFFLSPGTLNRAARWAQALDVLGDVRASAIDGVDMIHTAAIAKIIAAWQIAVPTPGDAVCINMGEVRGADVVGGNAASRAAPTSETVNLFGAFREEVLCGSQSATPCVCMLSIGREPRPRPRVDPITVGGIIGPRLRIILLSVGSSPCAQPRVSTLSIGYLPCTTQRAHALLIRRIPRAPLRAGAFCAIEVSDIPFRDMPMLAWFAGKKALQPFRSRLFAADDHRLNAIDRAKMVVGHNDLGIHDRTHGPRFGGKSARKAGEAWVHCRRFGPSSYARLRSVSSRPNALAMCGTPNASIGRLPLAASKTERAFR